RRPGRRAADRGLRDLRGRAPRTPPVTVEGGAMSRPVCLCLAVLFLLALAPAAAADGPMPYASQLGTGVLSADGSQRYVAVPSTMQSNTTLEDINTADGTVRHYTDLAGSWGVPVVTYGATGDGL